MMTDRSLQKVPINYHTVSFFMRIEFFIGVKYMLFKFSFPLPVRKGLRCLALGALALLPLLCSLFVNLTAIAITSAYISLSGDQLVPSSLTVFLDLGTSTPASQVLLRPGTTGITALSFRATGSCVVSLDYHARPLQFL
jgi:hypothetical protein